MLRKLSVVLLATALVLPFRGLAEADGPDFFRIKDVAADDVLNIRTGPGASHDKIGSIPPTADGIRNLGCQGGLSYAEWAEASQAERDAAAKRRWCHLLGCADVLVLGRCCSLLLLIATASFRHNNICLSQFLLV